MYLSQTLLQLWVTKQVLVIWVLHGNSPHWKYSSLFFTEETLLLNRYWPQFKDVVQYWVTKSDFSTFCSVNLSMSWAVCSTSENHLLNTEQLQRLTGQWDHPKIPFAWSKAAPQPTALALDHGPWHSHSRSQQQDLQQTLGCFEHILIMQFRSCHKGNEVFKTRKSFTLCSWSHSLWSCAFTMEPFRGLINQICVWQQELWMELLESGGLRKAEIHQCL